MMRFNRGWLSAAGAAALCCAAASTANGQCAAYNIAPGPGTFTAGTNDIGSATDDNTTQITLPFIVSLYGVSFTTVEVGSNGYLDFTNPQVGIGRFANECLPSNDPFGPVIFALWDDFYTVGTAQGLGIFTDLSGAAGSQVFSIEWRVNNYPSTAAPIHNFCVKFYENQSFFDVVYQTLGTPLSPTVGVQNSTTGPQSQYYCSVGNVGTLPTAGASLRFSCQAVAPSGTCCTLGSCTFVQQVNCPAPGSFSLGGACTPNPCPVPPANDNCESAPTVSAGAPAVSGNSALATSDGLIVCVGSSRDLWYSFTAAAAGGAYQIDTCGSLYDTVLSVHDNCPSLGGIELACNDDSTCGLDSIVNIILGPSQVVKIRLAGFGGANPGGNFILNIIEIGSGACCNTATNECTVTASNSCTGGTFQGNGTSCAPSPCPAGACCNPSNGGCSVAAGACPSGQTFQSGGVCTPNPCPQPLPNDTCGGAITVSAGTPAITGNNSTALDNTALSCGLGGPANSHKDVWYVFNPGAAAGTYQIDTCGSLIDTILAVYDNCTNLTELVCNDDSTCGLDSIVSIELSANTSYFIAIAAWGGAPAGGAYSLNIGQVGTGACCFNGTGACSITASNACTGGTYRGNDTVCATIPCGTGACCTAGNCTVLTGSDCVGGGGVFQGHSASCGGASYTIAPGGAAYASIAATGTQLANVSNCDDCGETVTLPFFYSYLGTSFGDVWVTSNGYIQFGATDVFFGNAPIPTAGAPNNFVAPLWDDLYTIDFGDVYTLAAGVAPNQTFTISYEGVEDFAVIGALQNFQVVIHESGNIEFRYGDLTVEPAAGDWTVGFENSTGTSGASVTGASLGAGNVSLTLTGANVPDPCTAAATGACCCGSSCSITTSAACAGTNQSFVGGGTVCTPFSLTAPCCRANFNKSAPGPNAPGGVSVQDIFDFLTGYFSQSPCADTNSSGGLPSVQDIFDFLTAYFGGC